MTIATPRAAEARTRRGWILFFAAATGYISLSQEMLWFRAIGYATGGKPNVFAQTLAFFLTGVAAGAYWGEKRTVRDPDARQTDSAAAFVSLMLVASAAICYLALPLAATIFTWTKVGGYLANYLLVAVLSACLGAVFPVFCHYGIRRGESVGIGTSHIYAANVVGSTLGPLLTGFVLMEYLTTARLIQVISLGTLALALVTALPAWRATRGYVPVLVGAALLVMIAGHATIYRHLLEKLERKREFVTADGSPSRYKYVLENRHGIVSVLTENNTDKIFGGGAYDGTFNIDPVVNSNLIRRAYFVAALHPRPADVLVIGISGGSWVRVLCDYAPIEHITAIEINPAYLELMGKYPEIGSIRDDPKLKMSIDDGRRWLHRNPEPKFDFILQNTTYHWRSNITNLVSAEYLELCKSHLNPGGVMYWNTTGSEDIAYTAARKFRYVARYLNFVAASDSPFALTPQQVRENLMQFRSPDGKIIFADADRDPAVGAVVRELAEADLSDKGAALRERRDLYLISDDNMATEFKSKRVYDPSHSWWAYLHNRGTAAAAGAAVDHPG
jgi:spermidine synthase/glycerol-3-phosphate acyltransferase PlsY